MSILQNKLNEIKRQKDTYLLPENIKNGLTILGITGTFLGGGGSSEGIKLFDTIANMQNSSNNNNGDLAIVYNNTSNDYQGIFEFEDNVWNIAETGLSATSRDVVSSTFQGKNGVETGTLQSNTNISLDELKYKSQVYDNLSTLYFDDSITDLTNMFNNNLDITNVPSLVANNVTECCSMFENCSNLMSVGEINFPNCNNYQSVFKSCINLIYMPIKPENFINGYNYSEIYKECLGITDNIYDLSFMNTDLTSCWQKSSIQNISNITAQNCKMASAFRSCNITTINDLNFTRCNLGQLFWKSSNSQIEIYNGPQLVENCVFDNSTNAFQLFVWCSNLTTIKNITFSNTFVTRGMFAHCLNLSNISNINLFNLNNASAMFENCRNLTDATEIRTLNIKNMATLFKNCINLVEVPNFDTTSTNNMTGMFTNCNSLSNNAYANITNMLPLATNLTNQYLSNIGLNRENFTNEQITILNSKGYVDAVTIEPLTYYNIYYNTTDEGYEEEV